MEKTDQTAERATPVFPRRAFVAAGLSAIVAGGAVGLGYYGGVTAPVEQTFQFSRGTSLTAEDSAALRAFLTTALTDDRFVVTVIGHTGEAGDPSANQALSEARAMHVLEIATNMGIPASRIVATGVGGADPLPKDSDETDRAHQSRLARVVVSVQLRR